MAITQPRAFGAFSGGQYGTFAGKGAGVTPHKPVGVLTQLRAFGAFSGQRYGSFVRGAGGGSTHPVDLLTQLRAFGAFSGARYGSFAGRVVGPEPEPEPPHHIVGSGRGPIRVQLPRRHSALDDEDELMAMILAAFAAINSGTKQ